jgi:[acyl-carrier-protein] S-malonyltransferase
MPAQERLAEDLRTLEYGPFEFPIVHNVDASVNQDRGRVEMALTEQVSNPVLWLQSIRTLRAAGVGTFAEIGPGKVLSGLLRQIDRDARAVNVEDKESLGNTLETL